MNFHIDLDQTNSENYCKICDIRFKSLEKYEAHNADFHPEVTICIGCNEQILDIDDSWYHLKNCISKIEFTPGGMIKK